MDAVPGLVMVGVLALWAPLRLMRCEGCAMPFSLPQALYRVVSFEGTCRACPEVSSIGAAGAPQARRLAAPAPSPIVECHRRVRAGVEEMVRAQLAETQATHRALSLSWTPGTLPRAGTGGTRRR